MENRKYELVDTMYSYGRTLHRIRALFSFNNVSEGDLGGWIESEDNLSQYGSCWVYDDSVICSDARVCDGVIVEGHSLVWGSAVLEGHVRVAGESTVEGLARVSGRTVVSGNAVITGDVVVCDDYPYLVFKNTWSSLDGYFTYTSSNQMWKAGDFYGTGKELIARGYEDSDLSGACYESYGSLVENLEVLGGIRG